MKASVIIPTYNGGILLKQTVCSLTEQDFPKKDYEVIIVDNGSRDNTAVIASGLCKEFPNVIYVFEPEPGLHNARHAGARVAKAELLLFADDDVRANKSWVSEIVGAYTDENIGCVGGKIVPEWEIAPPHWINRMPLTYLSLLDAGDKAVEIKWIYGCNFSIRKKLLFALGGFNPDAFGDSSMWWFRGDGEIGLLRKVKDAGYKIMYAPNAVVRHFIPFKRLKLNYFRERAYKDGIEASFVKYRYTAKKNSRRSSACSIVFFSSVWLIAKFLSLFSLRFDLRSHYLRGRCLHEYKIMTDDNLSEFVKKESWLKS